LTEGRGACIMSVMKMTRTHFQSLADLCAEIIANHPEFTKEQCISIIDSFIDVCDRSNKNFDPNRFQDWVDDKTIKN